MRDIYRIDNHHDVLLSNRKYFSTRYTVKNAAIAERIAGILGGQVRDIGMLRTNKTDRNRNYVVPVNALSRKQAEHYGVHDADSVLGGIVDDPMQAEKGVLHPPVRPDALVPSWYSRSFANKLVEAEAVLPGFVVFTEDDAKEALARLKGDGFSVRYKTLPESGGRGQYAVQTPDELQEVIYRDRDTFLQYGAVLEAGVQDPKEINLAYVRMDGKEYSWIGLPSHGSGFRTDLTVVRGDFGALAAHLSDQNELLAVRQAQTVFDTYRSFGVIIGRGAFDVLQGTVADKTPVSRVVDPVLRVGGSTPAELRAIEKLIESPPDITRVDTRVVSDHKQPRRSDMDGYEVFVKDPAVDVYVKVLNAA